MARANIMPIVLDRDERRSAGGRLGRYSHFPVTDSGEFVAVTQGPPISEGGSYSEVDTVPVVPDPTPAEIRAMCWEI